MTKTAAVLTAALSIIAILYSATNTTEVADKIEIPVAPWMAEECTTKLEIECAIDV